MSALDTVAGILARRVRGYEARKGIEAFAHHLCAALRLPPVVVTWTDSTNTAAMSQAGTMLLADMRDDEVIDRARVARLAAFVLHELLHRRYTDFAARDDRPYVDALHNALEDAWIERRAARDALVGNCRPLLTLLVQDMVREAMAQVTDWADPRQYPFALAVLARGYGVTVPVPHAILPAFQRAAAQVDACQSSHDTLALARDLFDALQLPQQPQGDQGQDGQQQAQDGQQDGEEGAAQDGQPNGQEGAQEGNRQDGQQQETPQDAGPARVPSDDTQAREVEPRDGQATGPGGSFTATGGKGSPSLYDGDRWGSTIAAPARLRHDVRRMFENTAREWKDAGYRSGSLHRGSLHRVALDRPDIFARRMSADGIDSAVAILLDVSYSMTDMDYGMSRISCAVDACAMLLDCLAQAGADAMVLGFGYQTHMLKGLRQPWRQAMPTLRRVKLEGHTNDFHALRTAHDALLAHPAQRRVVLAITDGQGNFCRTREQRLAGEALGIQHYGIGIGEDVTYTWGQASVTIRNPADLGTVALSQLRRA